MEPEQYWGWAGEAALREGGESGGAVTGLVASVVDSYDEVIVIKKTGTIFEGIVHSVADKAEVGRLQGALHAVSIELSHYITLGKKTAIVLKPCDARAVIENIKRNHVRREDVLLIGLNCGGTLPPAKTKELLQTQFGLAPEDVTKEEIAKGNLIFFKTDGEEVERSIDELEESGYGRRESCRYCDVKIPSMCDIAFGNWGTPAKKNITFIEVFSEKGKEALEAAVSGGYLETKAPSEKLAEVRAKINTIMVKMGKKWRKKLIGPVMAMDKTERLAYIQKTLAPCIGCYACRKACPVCKCGDDCKCYQADPDDALPISMFHSVRLLHLMESCVGCGQCSDACPMDIPLAHLHQLFAKAYEDKTGYKPGMSAQDVPPLTRGDFPEGY